MKFAKIVFWGAGIWGVLVLTPLYFMYDLIGRQEPPPITHPGFYYGFAGVALAWQFSPSVRFPVESGDKKKEGVSQRLCLGGQKGDTPCHQITGD
jgi:hypothetical protein